MQQSQNQRKSLFWRNILIIAIILGIKKCAGIFQLENLSLGPTNSAAKVIFYIYMYKKKIAWQHGDVQESNRSHLLCRNEGLEAQWRPAASEDITSCCH